MRRKEREKNRICLYNIPHIMELVCRYSERSIMSKLSESKLNIRWFCYMQKRGHSEHMLSNTLCIQYTYSTMNEPPSRTQLQKIVKLFFFVRYERNYFAFENMLCHLVYLQQEFSWIFYFPPSLCLFLSLHLSPKFRKKNREYIS